MIVSNPDFIEENWNFKQKELTKSRNGQRKLNNNKVSSFKPFNPKSLEDSFSKQKTVVISRNRGTNNLKKTNQNQTSLRTPTTFRNNTSADPYGINPLPDIKSPFVSSREPNVPNLESWGVRNYAQNDFYFNPRLSPYLPTYTSLVKNQKPYIVVPSLNKYQTDPKFSYISVLPYNRPDFDEPLRKEFENQKLKSDEFVKQAQKVLKETEQKKLDDDLFSTKFIEDLLYKPEIKKKPIQKKVRLIEHDPIAEEYIETIKSEAYQQIPEANYSNNRTDLSYNLQAIDIAENLYKSEINSLIRQLAERTFNEEKNSIQMFEKPIFDSIYESTVNKMVKQIAEECLASHFRQIEFIEKNEVKKFAKEKIVDNLLLDKMLETVASHGKIVAENDEAGKLLDGMILDILLHTHSDVRKSKEKTLDNYPIKKFHLNSFMNVALDILVSELSTSLEEDLKELDIIERNLY